MKNSINRAMTLAIMSFAAVTSHGAESIEAQLKRVADETRKSLPILINEDLQATNIAAIGKVLMNRYNFTKKNITTNNLDNVKTMYYRNSVNSACTNPDTIRALNNGVSFEYQYYDANNKFVMQYTINEKTCLSLK